MKSSSGAASSSSSREAAPRLVTGDEIRGRMQESHDAVARRAFELFEGSAHEHGHELEHWLQAETELVEAVQFDLEDARDEVVVRAKLPGFTTKDVEVGIEPHRLTVYGKRRGTPARRSALHMSRARWVCGSVDIPEAVDTAHARARFRSGLLAVELPKVHANPATHE